MNILFLLISLIISAFFLFLGLFFLKVKYVKSFDEDTLISSNEKNYALFDVDNKYKEYVNSYKIIKEGNNRFLALKLKGNVKYINFNIVCYKNEKLLKILNIKDVLNNYKEDYIVKLPLNASSFKIDIIEVNDIYFIENEDIKKSVYKYILSSLFFSISATIAYFLIYLITLPSSPSSIYDSWDKLIESVFYVPIFYILGAILFLLTFIISFLILFFLNKEKRFAFKENKKKDEEESKEFNIYKYLKFNVKTKKDKKDNSGYFIIKLIKKREFIKGEILIKAIDVNNEPLLSFPYKIDKHFKKINIKKNKNIKELKISYNTLYFKKFRYINNEAIYNEYLNKNGVKCETLHIKGVLYSILTFALIFITSLGANFYASYQLNIYRNIENYLNYEFINEENEEEGIKIVESPIKFNTLYIPKEIDGYKVVSIGEGAFKNNEYIKKVYFSNEIEIESEAFLNCSSLEYVDLSKVNNIGLSSFEKTSLKEIYVGKNLDTVNSKAFAGIKTLKKVTLDNPDLALGLNVFRNSVIDGDLIINYEPIGLQRTSFIGISCNEVYIYDYSKITKVNYNVSYYLKRDHTYFLSECIHDDVSFIVDKNGKIIKTMDVEVSSTFEGTCIEKSYTEYLCHRCGNKYKVEGKLNFQNHNFVDGYCTWCGKAEDRN